MSRSVMSVAAPKRSDRMYVSVAADLEALRPRRPTANLRRPQADSRVAERNTALT
jgi:hypothetical protein